MESQKIDQLQTEISTLRTQLAESDRKLSVVNQDVVLLRRSGSSALNDSRHSNQRSSLVNDSWMDSGDEEESPRDKVFISFFF